MKTLTAKAKAFTGEKIREHKFAVYDDGTVRVWDDIAGHYTTCHALSSANIAKLLSASLAEK